MKRSGFQNKPRKHLKRTQIKRVVSSIKKKKKTAPRGKNKPKKTTTGKGYKCPKWFMVIKPGAHGKKPAQKRLWRVVSETYREEDWETHGKYCAICGVYLERWQDGQLGHWLAYSCCNGWFKYERRNLALICAGCNCGENAITQHKLGEVLRQRHGEDVLLWIEKENQATKNKGVKQEDWMCVDYAAKIAPHLVVE